MIEDLKPYPEYKNSGLPWLGMYPKSWNLRRTKSLFKERIQKGYPSEPLLAATQTRGVIKKEDYAIRTVTAQKDLHLLKLVDVGDYVISLRSFQGGIEVAHCRGIISPAYTVLSLRNSDATEYYSHFFKSKQFIDSLSLFVTGIREGQNIDYERLSRVELPLPSQTEQAAIIRFLDHANRKIDGFIRAKKKLIGLLNEQKQAIIQHAVTRGLDPDVKLKPSGIPWLGDIPEHWDTPFNRQIFKETIRPNWGKPELPLSLSQRDGLIPTDEMKERSLKTSSFKNWKVVIPGDLVLNRFKAHLGVFFASTLRGIVSFHYGVFSSQRQLNTKYFELLFHITPYRIEYAGRSNGMTVGLQNLSNQNFYSVRSIFPPIQEQDAIISYLKNETSGLDFTISRLEREIDLFNEYRARLTADIVTGKLDVREAAANLPEVVESSDSDLDVMDREEEIDETESE